MRTIYEVYTGNGEENTVYFFTKTEAMEYAKTQVIDDEYTVVRFKTDCSIVDALNGTVKQIDRTIILDTHK